MGPEIIKEDSRLRVKASNVSVMLETGVEGERERTSKLQLGNIPIIGPTSRRTVICSPELTYIA